MKQLKYFSFTYNNIHLYKLFYMMCDKINHKYNVNLNIVSLEHNHVRSILIFISIIESNIYLIKKE